jgi:regulator of replication initiation timing
MLDEFDPKLIKDEYAREGFIKLLNLVETLQQENQRLREENQQLRDENNRLKGEQGKPKFQTKQEATSISSEQERKTPKPKPKGSKQAKIEITREETLKVDKSTLPEDATFKGYESVVVQDLVFKTENVRFLKEKYYSVSEQKS